MPPLPPPDPWPAARAAACKHEGVLGLRGKPPGMAEEWWALQQTLRNKFLRAVTTLLDEEPMLQVAEAPVVQIRGRLEQIHSVLLQEHGSGEAPSCDVPKLKTFQNNMEQLLSALTRARSLQGGPPALPPPASAPVAAPVPRPAGTRMPAEPPAPGLSPTGGGGGVGGAGGGSILAVMTKPRQATAATAPAAAAALGEGGAAAAAAAGREDEDALAVRCAVRDIMYAYGDAASPRAECEELLLAALERWEALVLPGATRPVSAATPAAAAAASAAPTHTLCGKRLRARYPEEAVRHQRLQRLRRAAREAEKEEEGEEEEDVVTARGQAAAAAEEEAAGEPEQGQEEGEQAAEQEGEAADELKAFLDERTEEMPDEE